MKVFHTPTTRSLRIVWLLEELGLPYEVHRLRFPPRLNDPDYMKLNPSGTVPALADGGVLFTESMAICDHVAMKSPEAGLIPARGEEGYADYLKWLWSGEATLMFVVSAITRALRHGLTPEHPFVADTLNALDARLADLEAFLEGRDFLACGRFTLADVSVVFPLYRMHEMKIAERMGPRTAAYYERLAARPAFQRALAV